MRRHLQPVLTRLPRPALARCRLPRPRALVSPPQVGDEVKVMILTQGDGRISLSTKQLESEAGDMLRDPAAVYDNAEEAAAAWRARRGSNPRVRRGRA
jgi:ribosomal protein S1